MSKAITARPMAAAEPIARLKRQMETGAACRVMTSFSYCDNDHTFLCLCKEGSRHNPEIIYHRRPLPGMRGEEFLITTHLDRIDDPQDVPATEHGLLPDTPCLVSGTIALALIESLM